VPDRIRITKPESVGLIIGGNTYVNVRDAGWVPAGAGSTLLVLMQLVRDDSLITVGGDDTVTDEGTDTLNATPMRKYAISASANGVTFRRMLWVGEKDRLPHRVERFGYVTPLTAVYSAFNQDFGIETPAKVEPMTQRDTYRNGKR